MSEGGQEFGSGRGDGSPIRLNPAKDKPLQSMMKLQSQSPMTMNSVSPVSRKVEESRVGETILRNKSKMASQGEITDKDGDKDSNSQVWQHISLNSLAKKSSLAGGPTKERTGVLEKGRSMKPATQGIRPHIQPSNDNIDISS
jgi:hypothetical protein